MSIITDALKKAEGVKDLRPSQGQDHFLRPDIKSEIQKKSKQINWGPIFVLMVLFLITGPLVAPIFSTPFRQTNFPAAPLPPHRVSYEVPIETAANLPASSTLENRKAQFAFEETPLNPNAPPKPLFPTPTPRLNLTGIVFSGKDSYCLINGKVVKIGEEVSGAKLTAVEPHQARLLYQGEELTLSIPE